MNAVKCIYCDMPLTREERDAGQCESCGKRTPALVMAARPMEEPSSGAGKVFGGLAMCLVGLFVLLVLFAATGDPSILARVIAIPIVVGVGAVVRLVASLGRMGG